MARFRATIKGQRGEASRLGSAKSGIVARVRGWDVGVQVVADVDADGRDVLHVFRDGGSNGRGAVVLVATIRQEVAE